MAKNSALLWPGLSSPLLILTGEPTSNLDSKSSQTVIRPFRQAKSALGATIFMVPHESFDISSCDRVEILRDGVIWRTLERGSLERSTFQDQLLDAIWDMDKECSPAERLILFLRAAGHRVCEHDALPLQSSRCFRRAATADR